MLVGREIKHVCWKSQLKGQALDQFGRSCGREERLSFNETLSFHEPRHHRNDETTLNVSKGRRSDKTESRHGFSQSRDCATHSSRSRTLIPMDWIGPKEMKCSGTCMAQ